MRNQIKVSDPVFTRRSTRSPSSHLKRHQIITWIRVQRPPCLGSNFAKKGGLGPKQGGPWTLTWMTFGSHQDIIIIIRSSSPSCDLVSHPVATQRYSSQAQDSVVTWSSSWSFSTQQTRKALPFFRPWPKLFQFGRIGCDGWAIY